MTCERARREVIGLSAVFVASLILALTSSANAETGHWWTKSGGVEVLLNQSGSLSTEADTMPSAEVTGLNLKLLCSESELAEGVIQSNGKASGTLKVKNACEARSITPNEKLSACTVAEPIVVKVVALPFLHEGKTYSLVSPATGTTFTTLKFSGEFCVLPEEVSIKGTAVVEDANHGDFGTYLLRHLLQEASPSLFSSPLSWLDEVKFAGQIMRLNIWAAWVRLTGGHNDLEWKFLV